MSVNWNWKDKVGELVFVRELNGERIEGSQSIYLANCLFCTLQEFTDDEGNEKYNFCDFYLDKSHLKKCLGLMKNNDGNKVDVYKEMLGWELELVRITRLTKETKDIIECFANAGYKIEIELKKGE